MDDVVSRRKHWDFLSAFSESPRDSIAALIASQFKTGKYTEDPFKKTLSNNPDLVRVAEIARIRAACLVILKKCIGG